MTTDEMFQKLQEISDDYEMMSNTLPGTAERCISAAIGGLIGICKQQDKLIKELVRDNENHGRSIEYIEKVLKIDQI